MFLWKDDLALLDRLINRFLKCEGSVKSRGCIMLAPSYQVSRIEVLAVVNAFEIFLVILEGHTFLVNQTRQHTSIIRSYQGDVRTRF